MSPSRFSSKNQLLQSFRDKKIDTIVKNNTDDSKGHASDVSTAESLSCNAAESASSGLAVDGEDAPSAAAAATSGEEHVTPRTTKGAPEEGAAQERDV